MDDENTLTLSLPADLYRWLATRPEGAPAFVVGLIKQARDAEDDAEVALELASEAG